MVIIMVNGNVGAGLAVAGTFALVRFPRRAGNGKGDRRAVPLDVDWPCLRHGLYICCHTVFRDNGAFVFLLTLVKFGERNSSSRMLKITIPETLDYDGLFDDLFDKYTSYHELVRVRTTNMGRSTS